MGDDAGPFEPAARVRENRPTAHAERRMCAGAGHHEHAAVRHRHRRNGGPPAPMVHGAPSGRPGGNGPERATSGSRNGRFTCTGPRQLAHRRRRRPRCQRSPSVLRRVVRDARIDEPPDGPPVEVGLVDRLRGADVTKLWWPVGRAHEHRYLAEVRFDDRGMQVGRRRPTRGENDSGHARRRTDPECGEPCSPLVMEDVDVDLRSIRERDRQRGGSGAGRDDRVPHTGAHPFVDERGGERRLRCHGGVHHRPIFVQVWNVCAMSSRPCSTRTSTVRVRASCSSTASRRTATVGERSRPSSRSITRSSASTRPATASRPTCTQDCGRGRA